MKGSFQSTHNLPFLGCPWERDPEWTRFKIGTCCGLWMATADTYDILAVDNDSPGNGHFDDVLEWFFNSCQRDKKDLRIMELFNDKLRKHLINKRGFEAEGDHVRKRFKSM